MKQSFILALSILSVLLLSVPEGTAQQTRMLTADKSNEYGLVYTLPETAVLVSLTARRDVSRRGPFYQYAKKYLGTDKVVLEDSEKWTLTGATMETYGIADTENQYLMQLKPGSVTSICVDQNGMLLAINVQAQNPWTSQQASSPVVSTSPHSDPSKDYLQYVDDDFIASQSAAKQAQMLAESLMEVREAKIALTRGTADPMPTDGRQLELMLSSLERQEKAMTEAFTGVTWSETETRDFDLLPREAGRSIVCRLSDFAGFVDAEDLSGDPVYMNVEIVSEGSLPVDARGEEKKIPRDAVIYNLPGSASLLLSFKGKKLVENEFRMAQFGTSFGLAPTLFSDKKEPYCAIFDPVTGALLESKAIKPEEAR